MIHLYHGVSLFLGKSNICQSKVKEKLRNKIKSHLYNKGEKFVHYKQGSNSKSRMRTDSDFSDNFQTIKLTKSILCVHF